MISVVIPLYNKAECISRTIESVLSQTYEEFEIIVVNDGSTDGSVNIVSQLKDDRIRIVQKPNGGVSSARNLGVQSAKYDWIVFLDADDVMMPNNLEVLHNQQLKYKTDVATGNYYVENQKGELLLKNKRKKEGVSYNNLKSYYLDKFCMRMGCALIKKEFLLSSPFPENLNRFEDLYTIIDLCKKYTISFESTPILTYTADFRDLSALSIEKRDNDFTFNLEFKDKTFWEKLIYGQLLVFASYNDELRVVLKKKYGVYYWYRHIAFVGFKVKKIISYVY